MIENQLYPGIKINKKRLKIEIDCKFWAILPCFNVNLHSLDLEFEWLCFGIYYNFWKKDYVYRNVYPETFWKNEEKID